MISYEPKYRCQNLVLSPLLHANELKCILEILFYFYLSNSLNPLGCEMSLLLPYKFGGEQNQ